MIETKKEIAILTVAVAALALTALISTVSAVPIGNHDITFVGPHDYDPATCISRWTYEVTSSSQQGEGLSHWVMEWCNEGAFVGCSPSETCMYVYDDPGKTGITGIKIEGDYEGGITKTVWFELKGCGDYNEGDREVCIKAGNNPKVCGDVKGPMGLGEGGCDPVPELPTIILLGAGLLALAGYVGLRRKKE